MIDTHVEHFSTHGYVRLPSLLPPDAIAAMADALWSELWRKHGIARTDRATWTMVEPRGLGALRKAAAFDPLATAAFKQAINTLLATNAWPHPASWGDPLVTLPTPTPGHGTVSAGDGTPGHGPNVQAGGGAPGHDWTVPVGGWHIDFPVRGAAGSILLLKWLAYLAPVNTAGGGTVVLSGSHRLVERFTQQADPADPGRSPAVRDAIFSTHPWLRTIRQPGSPSERVAQLMTQGATIDGIPLRVVELTGQPGDVVFMHPHLFHAPAPNKTQAPRLMLTGGVIR